MASFVVEPIDFLFDFATTNLSVGSNTKIGLQEAYTAHYENRDVTTPLTLPNEGYGEVAGIEIAPGVVAGVKEHMSAKIIIGGQSFEDQVFNEMTAPMLSPGAPDALGAAGLRYGQMPINLGLPMMMGGRPEESCPKVPPGRALEVEVTCPQASEGGVALTQPAVVRLWICKALTAAKVKESLLYASKAGLGNYDGNVLNCSFDLGDIDVSERMPMRTSLGGNPIKNLIPETNTAFEPAEHWGKLPGGMEQDRPKLHVASMFSKQMKATDTNAWYQFVLNGSRVQSREAELYWDFTKRDALKITHLAFKNPAAGVLGKIATRRTGRETDLTYQSQFATNCFPMPAFRSVGALSYCGPVKLPKPFLVWGEIGSIEVKDNGTSVAGWAAATPDQAGIYYRGIRYELNEKEV